MGNSISYTAIKSYVCSYIYINFSTYYSVAFFLSIFFLCVHFANPSPCLVIEYLLLFFPMNFNLPYKMFFNFRLFFRGWVVVCVYWKEPNIIWIFMRKHLLIKFSIVGGKKLFGNQFNWFGLVYMTWKYFFGFFGRYFCGFLQGRKL